MAAAATTLYTLQELVVSARRCVEYGPAGIAHRASGVLHLLSCATVGAALLEQSHSLSSLLHRELVLHIQQNLTPAVGGLCQKKHVVFRFLTEAVKCAPLLESGVANHGEPIACRTIPHNLEVRSDLAPWVGRDTKFNHGVRYEGHVRVTALYTLQALSNAALLVRLHCSSIGAFLLHPIDVLFAYDTGSATAAVDQHVALDVPEA